MTHYRCLRLSLSLSEVVALRRTTVISRRLFEDFKNEWSEAFGCRSPLEFVGERPGFHQKNFRFGFHRQSVKDPRHFPRES